MDENTTTETQEQETTAQETTPQPKGRTFRPITTQEEFDERIKERMTRLNAKYAGFEEFKAKADKYDELAAGGTAEALERATKAEHELAQLKAERERSAWNVTVSERTGLPVSMVSKLAASSAEELEEVAAQFAALATPTAPQPIPTIPYTPWDKKSYGQSAPPKPREQFAELMREKFHSV